MSRAFLFGLSIVVHGALAVSVTLVKPPKRVETIAITMANAKPKPAEKAIVPPKTDLDDAAPKTRSQAKSAVKSSAPAAAAKAAAGPQNTNASDAPPDFGELGGGNGIALPGGGGGNAGPTKASATAPKTVERAAVPAKKADDDCAETAGKPTPIAVPQPGYTDRAREAKIEGRVRVEITVDERGKVVSARVLQGLGYGLDEAALAAVRGASFKAAERCGKPARSTFVVGMRFSL